MQTVSSRTRWTWRSSASKEACALPLPCLDSWRESWGNGSPCPHPLSTSQENAAGDRTHRNGNDCLSPALQTGGSWNCWNTGRGRTRGPAPSLDGVVRILGTALGHYPSSRAFAIQWHTHCLSLASLHPTKQAQLSWASHVLAPP